MKSLIRISNINTKGKRTTLAAIVAMALLIPVAAMADINSTATLSAGSGLDLDTGTTSTSGDILFTGTSITFQGGAKGAVFPGITGASGFAQINQQILQSLSVLASTAPIQASALPVGTIFAVFTKGGNPAKLLVTSISSGSIGLQYTTYGPSGTGPGAPTVTGVTNNYSFIPPGFPNSGISPSAIFTIFGRNMGAPVTGTLTLQSSAGSGLPKSLNGTTISVTVSGTTVAPAMYYETPTAIAAVLPANTPTGSGTLTVTYNGTASNAFAIQVVPSAFGLGTYYGTGTGLILATDAVSGALVNYTNSASPGEVLTLWGSGLGADTADSDTVFTTTPHAVNQGSVQVWIGGIQANVLYAGSSGYPGLNQINVTTPNGVTGCNNSVVVTVGADISNFATMPIAQGTKVCSDPAFGITGSQLSTLSTQTNVKSGTTFLGQLISTGSTGTMTSNFATASFQSVTGSSYGAQSGALPSIGSCVVTEVVSTSGGGNTSSTPLDPGSVSLTGPGGANYSLMSNPILPGFFFASLPEGAITSSGGTFVFNWTGGKDVGASSSTINLPNPLLSWTNKSSDMTVNRSQGVQFTWSGGSPGTWVLMSGSSSGNGVTGSFTCWALQSALQFMVPSYVTGTLPAGKGGLTIENITQYSTFTAPGIDTGIGFGFTGDSLTDGVVYQ